jgi:hypothetical protein
MRIALLFVLVVVAIQGLAADSLAGDRLLARHGYTVSSSPCMPTWKNHQGLMVPL